LLIGNVTFADNKLNFNDIEIFRSCTIAITTTTTNMFGQQETSTSYHYLGEVANNGFGNLDCQMRADRYLALYAD